MDIIYTLLLLFFVFAFWRKMNNSYSNLLFKYEIYKIRDQLRAKAIANEIPSDNWVFYYFDKSLSKTIAESYYITLFRMIVLVVLHGADEKLLEFNKKFQNEIEKNPELKSIHSSYMNSIKKYIISQHYVSIQYIIKPVLSPLVGTTRLASIFTKWARELLIFPETSESQKFAV